MKSRGWFCLNFACFVQESPELVGRRGPSYYGGFLGREVLSLFTGTVFQGANSAAAWITTLSGAVLSLSRVGLIIYTPAASVASVLVLTSPYSVPETGFRA